MYVCVCGSISTLGIMWRVCESAPVAEQWPSPTLVYTCPILCRIGGSCSIRSDVCSAVCCLRFGVNEFYFVKCWFLLKNTLLIRLVRGFCESYSSWVQCTSGHTFKAGCLMIRARLFLVRFFARVELTGGVSGLKPLDLLDAWLILPAVICSDERLSHACLRTYVSNMNLRTAH